MKQKKLIKIAVLDTGYTPGLYNKAVLCDSGHRDFTETGLTDNVWHGTHIINIIADRITNKDKYCIIVVKWFDPKTPKELTEKIAKEVFAYVNTLDVDIVNYSAGGPSNIPIEKREIAKLLRKNVKVLVAAGNEGQNLSLDCNFFPACYNLPKMTIVGSLDKTGKIASTSNYGGPINRWETGVEILAFDGNKLKYGSGTSQATAVATSKMANILIRKLLK